MRYVKNKEWLLKNLNETNVRIIDCRFSLAAPQKKQEEYREGHIPGASYFDLEQDLSGSVGDHGGRHPLPDLVEFVTKLEKIGINNDTTVIAYDDGEGAFAGRFWWLLQYLGHEHVYVLDGGFKGWLEGNYPLTTEIPVFERVKFHPSLNADLIAATEEVKDIVKNQPKDTILIDSREEKRYLGLEEPIDKKAGHIPGAINKPWMEGFRDGQYIPAVEQKQRFSEVEHDKKIIVYCGSGVTATPNFLALREAGYEKVKLYVGSFSDWISYAENIIE